MAQITLPHQLTNGTVADATQVMANFNAIVNVVNGNLGADNLSSISGADITVTDLNGGTTMLNNFTRRFRAGTVTFNNVPPNETVSREVTFPTAFPGEPIVVLTPRGTNPSNIFATPANMSGSSFVIYFRHTFTGTVSSLVVYWLAIYTGAFS